MVIKSQIESENQDLNCREHGKHSVWIKVIIGVGIAAISTYSGFLWYLNSQVSANDKHINKIENRVVKIETNYENIMKSLDRIERKIK